MDETKHRGLVMVAVQVVVDDLVRTRASMRALLLGSQTHLHFKKESDGRRRQILTALLRTGVRAVIVDASALTDRREARAEALRHLVRLTAPAELFVVERDDSLVRSDQQVLFRAVREFEVEKTQYRHLPKAAEPLLWVADAVAWCVVHAGWREQVAPLVQRRQVL